MRRKELDESQSDRRSELFRLVKILVANELYYERLSDIVLADCLLTENDAEKTVFTYNKLRVTYGVSICDDSQIITSYRLYEGDEQIRKTDCYLFRSEIEICPEDSIVGPLVVLRSPYRRFIGEIMYYDIKNVKFGDPEAEKLGNVVGSALLSGMEKVGDIVVKRLQNVKNVGKNFTVSIAKGVKVEVCTVLDDDWGHTDWDYMNNEGVVELCLSMEVAGEYYSGGSCDAFLCYPGGESMDSDSLRNYSNEAYVEMVGGVLCDYLLFYKRIEPQMNIK